MSHSCGSGCYQEQDRRSEISTPLRRTQRRRSTITAGGKTRKLSQHLINDPHPEVTNRDISHVLSRWKLRGVLTDSQGRQSWNYYAMNRRLGRIVRVSVSMSDDIIITAHPDRNATLHWRNGNRDWFNDRLSQMQERGMIWT